MSNLTNEESNLTNEELTKHFVDAIHERLKKNEVNFMLAREEIEHLLNADSILQTGSQVFGDQSAQSDFDLVVFCASNQKHDVNYALLEQRGFVQNGTDYSGRGSFWRHTEYQPEGVEDKMDLNIIYTQDIITYLGWVGCTKVAMRLGLDKEQRKVLFNTIIDETLGDNLGDVQLEEVSAGDTWKHKDGTLYKILHIANFGGSESSQPHVVYQGEDLEVWHRPLQDWHHSFSLYEKS